MCKLNSISAQHVPSISNCRRPNRIIPPSEPRRTYNTYVYIHTYVYTYVCIYTHVYVCIHVFMFMYIRIPIRSMLLLATATAADDTW